MVQKNIVKIIGIIALLCCNALTCAGGEYLAGVSTFTPRSQDINAARDIVGWHPLIHVPNKATTYVTAALTPLYNQSLRPREISLALFNTETLTISGSLVPGREPLDLLADYFGLSPAFSSEISIKPLIQNALCDIGFYAGFDTWVPGLNFQLHAPVLLTKWNLELEEQVVTTGQNRPFPAGYMATNAVQAPVDSFVNAIKGNFAYGNVEALNKGIIHGSRKKAGCAAIDVAFGYDFVLKDVGHAGLNLRATIPTGSRTDGIYFFEPRVGFGKNWQLGVGFTGQILAWEKDTEQQLYFFLDLNLTHYFKARQRRSFDFKENGFLSRYILLKEFDTTGNFDGTVLPAINATTLTCDVHVNIQVDYILMFGYSYNDFLFDIGYNGWIRSKERIDLQQHIPNNRYGIKGIQNVVDPATGLLSNLTQSHATIHAQSLLQQAVVADNPSPVFISTADINLSSAATPLVLTHKFFVHLSNSWPDCRRHPITPFVGLGAEIEFEGFNVHNAPHPDRPNMGQASIWIKGGFYY